MKCLAVFLKIIVCYLLIFDAPNKFINAQVCKKLISSTSLKDSTTNRFLMLTIKPIKNGGFLILGTIQHTDSLYLAKIDCENKIQWSIKLLGYISSESSKASHLYKENALMVYPNEDILLLYHNIFRQKSLTTSSLIKFNKDGKVLWAKKVHSKQAYNTYFQSIIPFKDKSFALFGSVKGKFNSERICLIKLTQKGEIDWAKSYRRVTQINTRESSGIIAKRTSDNGIIFSCEFYEPYGVIERHYLFVAKTDRFGNIVWTQRLKKFYPKELVMGTHKKEWLFIDNASRILFSIQENGQVNYCKSFKNFGKLLSQQSFSKFQRSKLALYFVPTPKNHDFNVMVDLTNKYKCSKTAILSNQGFFNSRFGKLSSKDNSLLFISIPKTSYSYSPPCLVCKLTNKTTYVIPSNLKLKDVPYTDFTWHELNRHTIVQKDILFHTETIVPQIDSLLVQFIDI